LGCRWARPGHTAWHCRPEELFSPGVSRAGVVSCRVVCRVCRVVSCRVCRTKAQNERRKGRGRVIPDPRLQGQWPSGRAAGGTGRERLFLPDGACRSDPNRWR
jgi:hypothetical protein